MDDERGLDYDETVDGSEMRRSPPDMLKKPCKY